jgi:two-component system response regulator RegX3
MTFVLVVEDEESISDPLSYMLRKEGFEVAICPTGPDALEAFDLNGADLGAARPRAPRGSWHRGVPLSA